MTVEHSAPQRLSRADLIVIGTLLVASFVVILNETVMSVAIPVLQKSLGVPPSVGQWLTTAFMLTMAIVIPLTGYLIQRFGTRVMYMAAMTLFTVGTVVAAIAPGFSVLLIARVIQALGTAIMLPLLMTTVMTIVPENRRGVMMGNISVVIAVAPALGPTLSGFILDHFSWRAIFYVVAPIAIVALVIGSTVIRDVGDRSSAPMDVYSIPLAIFGFGGLVYGLAAIGESVEGDTPIAPWIPLVVGVAALIAFVARQIVLARDDRALLDLRPFRSRPFTLSVIVMLTGMATMMGTFIVVPYFAQTVLALDAFQTGLITLPGGVVMGVASPIIGRIYDVRGPRPLVIPGTILVAAGAWILTTVSVDSSIWLLLSANLVLCLGLSATFTPLMTLGLSSVPPQLYSYGSAIVGTLQQVAGAIGTALFITVMTVVATNHRESGVPAAQAITDGVQTVFMVAGAMGVVLIVLGLFVRRPATPEASTASNSDRLDPDDDKIVVS